MIDKVSVCLRWVRGFGSALALLGAVVVGTGCGGGECAPQSTWSAIEQNIFERKGCTNDDCHGAKTAGGLDLRPGSAYDSLVHAQANAGDMVRVQPGDEERSLIYWKLLAATRNDPSVLQERNIAGGGMPAGGIAPLTEEEVDAFAAWIRGGAPSEGVVRGSEALLSCSAANIEPTPNKIVPLPEPARDEGVQFYSGAWPLPSQSENEVCFVTYYDLTDEVSDELIFDCGNEEVFGSPADGPRKCVAVGRSELAQDSQSHHSLIEVYLPPSDPNGPEWTKPWQCVGGDKHGDTCDPTVDDVCGERSMCATPPVTSPGCVGITGMPEGIAGFPFAGGQTRTPIGGSQSSTHVEETEPGIYMILPVKGFVRWNSHGFNLTDYNTTIEQWLNLTLVKPSERRSKYHQIYDDRFIFAMSGGSQDATLGPGVLPFTSKELCFASVLPRYSRLANISSHMHQRGHDFRVWLPPNDLAEGECAGTEGCPLTGDRDITCRFRAPLNCSAPDRMPDYQSFDYSDPLVKRYEPALAYDSANEADRTIIACTIYDNGALKPNLVKRESTKPNSETCADGGLASLVANCGCPAEERYCVGGDNEGVKCGGDNSICTGGGVCDACPVRGGITTDDEMMILLGAYYNESRCVGGDNAGAECNGNNALCPGGTCELPASSK